MKLDIRSIIRSTDLYNLHSHTQFCDGHADIDAMAAEARAKGFEYWGFSPHAPTTAETTCNMSESDMSDYEKVVDEAAARYPGTTFLKGAEVEYINRDEGPVQMARKHPELDYIIGSVHFLPTRDGRPVDIDGRPERFAERLRDDFGNDLDYVVRTFWQHTRDMIAAGSIDIIGHLDKIARNASAIRPGIEDEAGFRAEVERTVDAAIASGAAVEINTKHRESEDRYYPHPRYWSRLARAGVAMPVNSDAHTIEGADSSRSDALALLDAIVTRDRADASLVLVNKNVKEVFHDRGVLDLRIVLAVNPDMLRGATVADKVVGRGAAAIMAAGGVSQVYAEIISSPALEMLERYGIRTDYGICVDRIINRRGDSLCPIETATEGLATAEDCIQAIDRTLSRLNSTDNQLT